MPDLEAAELYRLEDLRNNLRELIGNGDPIQDHVSADDLLLDYIGDDEVTQAFNAIDKFYE